MRNTCQEYREQLLVQFRQEVSAENLLGLSEHPDSCAACAEFLRDLLKVHGMMEGSVDAGLPEPNYHRMRARIWEEIDRRARPSGLLQWIFRPAILAPALVILLGLSLYFLWPESGQQESWSVFLESMDIPEEVMDVEEQLSEEEIDMILQDELSGPISEYLLSRQEYNVLEEIYADQDEWDQVMDDLIAANL